MDEEALTDLGEFVAGELGEDVLAIAVVHGELTIRVRADHVLRALTFLRDHPSLGFRTLVDICAVDWPERDQRFEIVYHLLSMTQNMRIRVKIDADEDAQLPSAVAAWPAANWFEREIFDMYGVWFTGHPDLRRILTDYGFRGFPLRKDFPTTGYVEVRYSEDDKRVIYEPVSLTQEFRQFDFMSPWEGPIYPPEDKPADASGA